MGKNEISRYLKNIFQREVSKNNFTLFFDKSRPLQKFSLTSYSHTEIQLYYYDDFNFFLLSHLTLRIKILQINKLEASFE
mgnify:CR=1 FL=1